ncbi:MAG: DUF1588 domain-containing protein [Vicinamibacteria bacterium]|nr:DUF1588 domain-containing protein [Vicinamibacteria bacterium]
MKGGIAALVLVGLWTFPLTPAVARAEAPAARRTVLDGVFTVEQAKRGEKAFGSACSGCHGSDLAGDGFAPALAGPRFVGSWNGSTVKDLFELIRSSMPPDGAKGVSAETKADIIAHILTVNQYPAGDVTLEPDAKKLHEIRIVAPKPRPVAAHTASDLDPTGCAEAGRRRDSLTRLSKMELANTLRDLIGDEAADELPALSGLIASIPDDDRQGGFANLQWSLSADHVGGYLGAANEIGMQMSARADLRLHLLPCAEDPENVDGTCIESFLDDFAVRAWRRPLEPRERESLLRFYADRRSHAPARALGALITRVLMSPAFLFKQGAGPVRGDEGCAQSRIDESFARASRMSYGLWGTMPDAPLFAAARSLDLLDDTRLTAHIGRMATDVRARRWVETFFHQWLHYEQLPTEAYSAGFLGPVERAHLHDSAIAELDRFIDAIIWTDRGAYRDLMVSRKVLTDAPALRAIYGIPARTAPGAELAPKNRAGLLTRVALLAHGRDEASLVKRGAFVRRQFLCDPLKPPDPAQLPAGSLVPPEKDHRLTTRQRWEARTAPAICQGCHRLINPLGASLEAYDAIGRFRRFEKLPVPKSSPPRFIEHHIDTAVNPFIERRAEPVLKGPVALSALLGESPKANACFVEQLTKFVSGRALEREDMVRLEIVTDKMMQPGGSVQDVLLSVVKLHATREIGSPFP